MEERKGRYFHSQEILVQCSTHINMQKQKNILLNKTVKKDYKITLILNIDLYS